MMMIVMIDKHLIRPFRTNCYNLYCDAVQYSATITAKHRGVFRILLKIYDGPFLQKQLKDFLNFFMTEVFII